VELNRLVAAMAGPRAVFKGVLRLAVPRFEPVILEPKDLSLHFTVEVEVLSFGYDPPNYEIPFNNRRMPCCCPVFD
jgi:hypothetical protein